MEKGSAGERVELTTAVDSPGCGYDFTEGHRYRVYANEGSTTLCEDNQDLGLVEHPTQGPPRALWWALGSGAVLVAALILLRRRGRP